MFFFFSYLNLQLVINCQSRVLQSLNDGGVGVGQLCVFSHQGNRDALQEAIRTVKTTQFATSCICVERSNLVCIRFHALCS